LRARLDGASCFDAAVASGTSLNYHWKQYSTSHFRSFGDRGLFSWSHASNRSAAAAECTDLPLTYIGRLLRYEVDHKLELVIVRLNPVEALGTELAILKAGHAAPPIDLSIP
jgi:hypothetical protein